MNEKKNEKTIGEIKTEIVSSSERKDEMENKKEMIDCKECGYEIEKEFADSLNGDFYCNDCFSELFFTCPDCGETSEYDSGYCLKNDTFICEDCFEENYIRCACCDNITLDCDSLQDPDGSDVCRNCFYDNYFTCDDCGEIHSQDCAYGLHDSTICDSCYCNGYFTCDDCGEIYSTDDLSSCEDETLCINCNGSSNSNYIHSYNYKPKWILYREDRKERTYGIENEIECRNNDRNDLAEWIAEEFDSDVIFLKEDSTIDYGFEIVSHPMTIKKHKGYDWEKLLSYLSKNGCKSHNTKTCGLHIHASKRGLNEIEITKIVSFVNLNLKRFEILARRNDCNYAHYKKIENGKDLKDCKMNKQRYEVINLFNGGTIEFRLFKGTLKTSSLIACIELVDSIIEFCKHSNIGIGFIFKNPNRAWNKFMSFIEKDKKRYAELIVYISDMNERHKRRMENRKERIESTNENERSSIDNVMEEVFRRDDNQTILD